MRALLLATVFMLFPLLSAYGQQSLTTIFAENNGNNGGIFFDIENVGGGPISILSWDISIDCDAGPVGTAVVSVYTRAGTSQGFEQTMDGWTLVGTDTNVPCAATNLPSALSAGVFQIFPGETTGIAMVIETTDDSWDYTNGTGDNQTYNNGELEIRTGSATSSPFGPGGLNVPRVWNGTVFYEFIAISRPIPTLSEWGLIAMAGVLGLVGILAVRKRQVTA